MKLCAFTESAKQACWRRDIRFANWESMGRALLLNTQSRQGIDPHQRFFARDALANQSDSRWRSDLTKGHFKFLGAFLIINIRLPTGLYTRSPAGDTEPRRAPPPFAKPNAQTFRALKKSPIP